MAETPENNNTEPAWIDLTAESEKLIKKATGQFGKPIIDRVERALVDGIYAQRPATAIYSEDDHLMDINDSELNLRELAAFILMEKRFD